MAAQRYDEFGNEYDANGRLKPGSVVTANGKEYSTGPDGWGAPEGPTGGVYQSQIVKDPKYGNLVPTPVLNDAARFNRKDFFTDFGPGLAMLPVGLGIAQSLGSLGGLGASLSLPHGGAAELAAGLGGAAGAGAGAGGAAAGAGTVAAGGAMDAGIGLEAVRNSFLGLPAAGGAGAGGFTAAQLADSGVTAPWTDLSRQAGFADTLRNVGLGQALQTGLTSTASSALTNGLRQPGSSNADAASRFLKDNLGIDISSGTLGLLGTLGGTALGAYGASQQSNAADANTQLQRDIYNNELSALQPSRNYYNDILQNPDTYYNSPQAKGAVNASLRGLSSQVGNPINNPSALAQSAAYNLGGYNNALNAAAGRAGLGNSASIAGLGSQYGNSILGQGQANGQLPNALGYGLSSLLNTRPNYYAA